MQQQVRLLASIIESELHLLTVFVLHNSRRILFSPFDVYFPIASLYYSLKNPRILAISPNRSFSWLSIKTKGHLTSLFPCQRSMLCLSRRRKEVDVVRIYLRPILKWRKTEGRTRMKRERLVFFLANQNIRGEEQHVPLPSQVRGNSPSPAHSRNSLIFSSLRIDKTVR